MCDVTKIQSKPLGRLQHYRGTNDGHWWFKACNPIESTVWILIYLLQSASRIDCNKHSQSV